MVRGEAGGRRGSSSTIGEPEMVKRMVWRQAGTGRILMVGGTKSRRMLYIGRSREGRLYGGACA